MSGRRARPKKRTPRTPRSAYDSARRAWETRFDGTYDKYRGMRDK